jgi:ATP:ADP antiporter, AAA family
MQQGAFSSHMRTLVQMKPAQPPCRRFNPQLSFAPAGYMTILLMLSGKFVFEYLGWGTAALATPVIMLFAGAAFFGLSLTAMSLGVESSTALLMAGAFAGAVTQVFARSSKFSLFDPAKEMVYIEMTKEEKSKGKAAVDLMGSQAGKSGASWIIQGALLVLGSATACLPVLATVYVAAIATWARAAFKLRYLMAETEEQRHLQDVVVPGIRPGEAVTAMPSN